MPRWVSIGNRIVDQMVEGKLSLIDWVLALSVLAYGGYHRDWEWIAFGVLGVVIALVNPARRIRNLIRRRMIASA